MPYLTDQVEPGEYRGLLVTNAATGHTELLTITAMRTTLDDAGNGVASNWVVRTRGGEEAVMDESGGNGLHTMLLFEEGPVPRASYVSLRTGIEHGTQEWDHLEADLAAIAEGSVSQS